MNQEDIIKNIQESQIEETIRSALEEDFSSSKTYNPFVQCVENLKKEIDFFQEFLNTPEFQDISQVYEASKSILTKSQKLILSETEIDPEADALLAPVQFHTNLLKIHKVLLLRDVECSEFIPPASAPLKKNVKRLYESLTELKKVFQSRVEKVPVKRKSNKNILRKRMGLLKTKKMEEEVDDFLESEFRVTPFITEAPKKNTVLIDGVSWPRFV